MSISESLKKIESSLGVLFHLGDDENNMTMDEARHLVALIQLDMAGHVEAIRYDFDRAEDVDLVARRARADLADAQEEIQRLTRRINVALSDLTHAGHEAVRAAVKCDDRAITDAINAAACRISAAARALRGQDELVEQDIRRAS
ncbi:MAG: hypothetical protein EOM10_14320 [Opitutae bacterium]|nr:hypothetical protein [Opitutae bacterium]